MNWNVGGINFNLPAGLQPKKSPGPGQGLTVDVPAPNYDSFSQCPTTFAHNTFSSPQSTSTEASVHYSPPATSPEVPPVPQKAESPIQASLNTMWASPVLDFELGAAGFNFGAISEGTVSGGLTDMRFGCSSSTMAQYLDQLGPVEERYPGVMAKLKTAEEGAERAGYTPTRAQAVIEQMHRTPPWPAGSYPDNMRRIAAKAQELGSLHPELKSKDASGYNLEAAQVAADKLFEELATAFPSKEFPDVNMAVRAKAPGSLGNKMVKLQKLDPEFSLAHVTDTVGARMDCNDLVSLGKMASQLEKLYGDKIVAKSDYLSEPGVNGYRALHYTVDIGGRMAEIQMTTHLLRATDLATHDTLYKPQFPMREQAAHMLATAADRAMFHECVQAIRHLVQTDVPTSQEAFFVATSPRLLNQEFKAWSA